MTVAVLLLRLFLPAYYSYGSSDHRGVNAIFFPGPKAKEKGGQEHPTATATYSPAGGQEQLSNSIRSACLAADKYFTPRPQTWIVEEKSTRPLLHHIASHHRDLIAKER